MSPIHQAKRLVFSLLMFFSLFSSCSDKQDAVKNPANGEQPVTAENEAAAGTATDLTFQPLANPSYNFKTEIPGGWTHATNEIGNGLPVINLYPKQGVKIADLPLVMQTAIGLTHIDIFPKGHGSGFPIGKNQRLAIYEGTVPADLSWDKERSRVYLLGNGEIWAYLLYPKSPPAGWQEEGFIFAQIAIDNFSSECFDDVTGFRKDMQQCKPLEGDEVLYYGRINPQGQTAVQHALEVLELEG